TVYADTTLQFWGLWFTNPQTGYISGSNGKIMKTTNRGDNWTFLTTPTSTILDGIWFVNENTGYVGGANIFLKTTDAGATWINKVGLFISPFETAQSVYFSDANTGYYCTNTTNGRIVKTTNGGDTWTLINDIANVGAGWDMSFVNPTTGYVCTSAGNVLKTTNAGVNWGVQNTPLTENLYQIHFPSVNTGYIACWSGKILKTTNGGLTFTGNINSEIPDKYMLEQNYPNPFNPQTIIRFSIPERNFITLKVFDIKGQEVKSLISEEYQPGNYEIKLTGDNLSSGVYYYRLQSKGFTETRKMILLK
ncbi:MAG: YCF48-related protein, partial [Ignavibacteria bacterium]